jgi:hypothetical protein
MQIEERVIVIGIFNSINIIQQSDIQQINNPSYKIALIHKEYLIFNHYIERTVNY